MGNQRQTLIPSRLKYITLLSHQTNNSQSKSIIGFNASIYNNTMDYLWVNIAYLSDKKWIEFKKLIYKMDRAYSEIGWPLESKSAQDEMK